MYLNTHSYYSYRYGTISIERLLETASSLGVTKLCLTDINSTSGCLKFLRDAPKYGIDPVVGVDFRNGADQVFIGLAKNRKGYRKLNDYLSYHKHHEKRFTIPQHPFEHCFLIYPYRSQHNRTLFDNEFIGIKPSEVVRTKRSHREPNKLVVLQTVSFLNKKDFNAHRLLRCIDKNIILSRLDKSEEGQPTDIFIPPKELRSYYINIPKAIHNSEKILDQCSIDIPHGDRVSPGNQKAYTSSENEDYQLVKKLAVEGVPYRYHSNTSEVHNRIEKELDTVAQKGFLSYFLINWDICRYARSKGYFYVGRGSGANSILAYLLRITDVDPIELDLYFERFINLFRRNPPDFDIDFSWTDREDITRYIFNSFDNVCLLGAYNTFKKNSIIREIGKVLGLPPHEIERVQRVEDFSSLDKLGEQVYRYGAYLGADEKFPNYVSVHASGILITQNHIHDYASTFLPPKGFSTVDIDMHEAEDFGLYKFDILSQRGLGKIKDAIEIVAQNNPNEPSIDINDLERFKKDEKIKHLLRNGQSIGCFYVESPAMRMLMKKLRVDHYLGLVAASSVIRPGVAQSGMMREYILRFRQPERRNDAHPVLQQIMPETFGVMVYQEDVIKVAHYFAGLTLAEADVLRRGMSGKFRSREEFQEVKAKFFNNCIQKNYTSELTHDIWRQIESFAGYAFAKGHSASYAVESYQSLFLKAHYPLEFMVAVINNFGGFYRTEFYVHEARMSGAEVEAPCVNKSFFETTINDKLITLGFQHIESLEKQTIHNTIIEREKNGPFIDFRDFINRVEISLEQVSLLIQINAFRFTGIQKKKILWDANFLLGQQKKTTPTLSLFQPETTKYNIPELVHTRLEDYFDELEILGFPLCDPFELVKKLPDKVIQVEEMPNYINRYITMVGYLVHVKRTSTRPKGDKMFFGTFIDQNGDFLDSTHFPLVAKQYPFRGKGIYVLKGKVSEEFDFVSLDVDYMQKLNWKDNPKFSDNA